MADLPELSQRETLVLTNVLRVLVSENAFNMPVRTLVEAPQNFGVPAIFLRPTVDQLCDKKLLLFAQQSSGACYTICNDYIDELYELGKSLGFFSTDSSQVHKETFGQNEQIPASDRFVNLNDNEPLLVEAREAVQTLSEAVLASNSLFADADERIQISEEVNFLGTILSKQKIHVTAVWDYTKKNQTLKSLANQVKSEIVKQAAALLFQNLDKLLLFLMSSL